MAKLTKYQLDALTKEVTDKINATIDADNNDVILHQSKEIEKFKTDIKTSDPIFKKLLELQELSDLQKKLGEQITEIKDIIDKKYVEFNRYSKINKEIDNYLKNRVNDEFFTPRVNFDKIQHEIVIIDLCNKEIDITALVDSIYNKLV